MPQVTILTGMPRIMMDASTYIICWKVWWTKFMSSFKFLFLTRHSNDFLCKTRETLKNERKCFFPQFFAFFSFSFSFLSTLLFTQISLDILQKGNNSFSFLRDAKKKIWHVLKDHKNEFDDNSFEKDTITLHIFQLFIAAKYLNV